MVRIGLGFTLGLLLRFNTDCRSFSIFCYLTGCRSNSHSVSYYILYKCKFTDAYVFVDVQIRQKDSKTLLTQLSV